jgi:hypothetical protein
MKRRDFLTIAATGLSGCAGQGSQATPTPTLASANSERPTARADAKQRIHLRSIGLNALIETATGTGEEATTTAVDIAMINPKDLPMLGTGDKFYDHEHYLFIATEALDNPSQGDAVDDLAKWRLRTKTESFRQWKLSKGTTLELKGIDAPEINCGLYGLVPMKRLFPEGETKKWKEKSVVSTSLHLQYGTFRDDIPRPSKYKHARRLWQMLKANEKFGEIPDLPVRMTDTVVIELEAPAANPAVFEVAGVSIKTKGDLVEAYLITRATKLHTHEEMNWHELHHVVANYELFETKPQYSRIPKTQKKALAIQTPDKVTEEPVFCPPAWFEAQ